MAVATQCYGVQPVNAVESTPGGVRVALADGRDLWLAAERPKFGRWVIEVESALRAHHPVAFVEEDGRLADLNRAHRTPVWWLSEFRTSPGSYLVSFMGYCAACALSRDHPEYERIYAALAAAAGTGQNLWMAVHEGEFIEDGLDEDGFTVAYQKILDARPAPASA